MFDFQDLTNSKEPESRPLGRKRRRLSGLNSEGYRSDEKGRADTMI
jgi:hypothetical protein